MVLTLVIVTDERTHYDALRAALDAAREHPSRILVTILRPGPHARPGSTPRCGSSATPAPARPSSCGMHGELADHAESVLLPLLLPDAPVVVWWPGDGPAEPAKDPVGALAQRRVTDAATPATRVPS